MAACIFAFAWLACCRVLIKVLFSAEPLNHVTLDFARLLDIDSSHDLASVVEEDGNYVYCGDSVVVTEEPVVLVVAAIRDVVASEGGVIRRGCLGVGLGVMTFGMQPKGHQYGGAFIMSILRGEW